MAEPKTAPAKTPIDPKASPPNGEPTSKGVSISNVPARPPEQATAPEPPQPAMESSISEQDAGKVAMDAFKKRNAAENEAGMAAVKRYSASRPSPPPPPPDLPPLGPPPTEPTKGVGPPAH